MENQPPFGSPRSNFRMVIVMLSMIAVPAALTLHTVKISAVVQTSVPNPSPYGYTVSLLLFIVPILAIGIWLVPQEQVKISKKSFATTIAVLFPLGVILDFFFARIFFTFGNPKATLGIPAPAIGGGVPIEEYLFYFTGFVAVLLIYIWLDEYWLAAYSVPVDSVRRITFERLVRFHPQSLYWAVALIGIAIFYRRYFVGGAGFPGYFTFLVLAALLPSAGLFPSALPVVNWRAFSLTVFIILLTSLLWEATLAVPYSWWGYRSAQMMGLKITAWDGLPIEAVIVWVAVSYATVIVYEIIRRWRSSGRPARHAFFG